MTTIPQRGEVWWCELPDIGHRPVLILSRDVAIAARRWAIVAPCTTRHRGLPSEVSLDPRTEPVPQPCVVTLDALESVSVACCVERLGRLSDATMSRVCAAASVALDC